MTREFMKCEGDIQLLLNMLPKLRRKQVALLKHEAPIEPPRILLHNPPRSQTSVRHQSRHNLLRRHNINNRNPHSEITIRNRHLPALNLRNLHSTTLQLLHISANPPRPHHILHHVHKHHRRIPLRHIHTPTKPPLSNHKHNRLKPNPVSRDPRHEPPSSRRPECHNRQLVQPMLPDPVVQYPHNILLIIIQVPAHAGAGDRDDGKSMLNCGNHKCPLLW
ncbi:hypothetical protein M758_9G145400 [Ceratodon purpureus]|nr:hypothetical protein M758_9G145400 [Ceratodon purpureus]